MKAIRLFTDPVLRAPCKPVDDVSSVQELAQEMVLAMHANGGIGLAANQIGDNRRVCVLWLENKTKQMILVNPQITHVSKDKTKENEGCLSCPAVWIPIKRHKAVVVKAKDLSGTEVAYEFTDMDARILQHEIDHLNGRLISDVLPNYHVH
jgi:peptide deformylase